MKLNRIPDLFPVDYSSDLERESFGPRETLQFFQNLCCKHDASLIRDVIERPNTFNYVAAGSSGFILFREGVAWKFSASVLKEYRLLNRVRRANKGRCDYVVNLKGRLKENSALKIEFIPGSNLEVYLRKYGRLDVSQVMHYGYNILMGLLELRNANIYHRDLHDRNILISDLTDTAIIVDLSEADSNPLSIHAGNRAYGGNNDLISLGQLMYKMSTGSNLFNESSGFSCYSAVKNGIKTVREQTYDEPAKLEGCLAKVCKEVPGTLNDIIVFLLNDDLWIQPSLEKVQEAKKMFEVYKSGQE